MQHLSLAKVSSLCQRELLLISREYVYGAESVCLFPSVSNINTNISARISECGSLLPLFVLNSHDDLGKYTQKLSSLG